ncbi:MAG: ABC transporter permease [Actinomycetota bacterium]|nr:ABC transporter permease [Actinomycetota bacterium]
MLRAAIRSLLAHKTRLGLTAVSIILGVAFIAGTYIYTDTTNEAFADVFDTAFEGVDVYVSGDSEFAFGQGVYFDQSVADDIAGVAGVARVEPALTVEGVQVIGPDGEPIGGGGPPQFGASVPSAEDQVATSFLLREGRAPVGAGEVVIDGSTVRAGEFELGDTVQIVSPTAVAEQYELVGVIGFGDADNLAGATVAAFDLATIQAISGRVGRLSDINIQAEPGVAVDGVVSAIEAVLPEDVRVQSAQSAAEEQAGEIQGQLGFFTNFLLVFAFVALFVGSFIIYNTFRIVIAQRMRELALMRAIGSTRGQVVRTVLLEAVLVGVASSLVGIAAGFGLAVGLRAILDAVGLDLPSGSMVLVPRTVIAGLVVGVVVTTASAVLPAVAASRIPPVAAMRADELAPRRQSLRLRAVLGTLVLATGAVLIYVGLTNDSASTTVALSSVGIGVLVMILGAYALSALLARPVAAVIGAPFARFFGVAGKLAQRNAGRSPRRTSATAAAIMVGIALITLASIMSASIQATVDEIFATGVDAEVVVTAPFDSNVGFSPELAARAAALPEVDAVTRVPFGPALLMGDETFVSGLDPNYADFFTIDEVDGSLDLATGELLVDSRTARDLGWAVGDPVELVFEETGPQQFAVGAVVASDAIDGISITREAYDANFAVDADSQVYIQLADGVSPEQGRDAVAAVTTDIPTADVQTNEELTDSIADQVNRLLSLITGLLGMTVLVALIGVTNTMALAVFERTREIGLLRAVGLNRPQTRRMIRFEASIISTFGALLGVALGIFFGWAIVQALAEEGFTTFVIPWVALAVWVLATAVLGVLFAIWPARRAAKLNVLAAISHE